jgi:methylenetetrahydrofolate dehydrogenase (NADP+)/methenyltetrahydrofolate cyclohydrolase
VHGILLQLPLPTQLNKFPLLSSIDPMKDVDGLTPFNLGCLMQKHPTLMPCTPTGIIRLLEHYEIPLHGKEMVVLNASALVGRPLALQALDRGATVTLCNSKTPRLAEHVKRAEILVSATGKSHLVPADWLNPKAVVIDVGVHRDPHLGLIGDVDSAAAGKVVSWLTPVPGGVGPMTVAMLMENVWTAYQRSFGIASS